MEDERKEDALLILFNLSLAIFENIGCKRLPNNIRDARLKIYLFIMVKICQYFLALHCEYNTHETLPLESHAKHPHSVIRRLTSSVSVYTPNETESPRSALF